MNKLLPPVFLTFLLSLPLLGFFAQENSKDILLVQRWDWVLYATAAVFLANIVLIVFKKYPLPSFAISPPAKNLNALKALLLLGLLALPFLSSRSTIDLATLVLLYICLAWGLNITMGLAGLLDLGYVAFYAIGAYTTAILSHYYGLSFWQCVPLSGVIAAIFALIIGMPILRVQGDYLAIVALGFAEIVRIVATNWQSLTGGPNGMSGMPRPTFFGLEFGRTSSSGLPTFQDFFHIPFNSEHRLIFLFYCILGLAIIIYVVSKRLRCLPLGRAWEAIREDEIACRALGINLPRIKLSAYSIGAGIAGLAGAFFATKQGFVSPESFTFNETAMIVAMVVLGGMGSLWGICIAATLLVLLPELARGLADYRMVLFGLAMILVMRFKPNGLISVRQPTVTMS